MYIMLIILGEATYQMLSWLILTFIGQLDIQQNGLTITKASRGLNSAEVKPTLFHN